MTNKRNDDLLCHICFRCVHPSNQPPGWIQQIRRNSDQHIHQPFCSIHIVVVVVEMTEDRHVSVVNVSQKETTQQGATFVLHIEMMMMMMMIT